MSSFINPAPNATYTSAYGMRTVSGAKAFHYGIDLAQKGNVPILSTASGTVTKADYHSTYGYMVQIKHTVNGKRYESVYAHLKEGSILVKKGDKIKQGEVIALMGNTGRSFGQHLHFEIHQGSYKYSVNNIDPWPKIKNAKPIDCSHLIDDKSKSGSYTVEVSFSTKLKLNAFLKVLGTHLSMAMTPNEENSSKHKWKANKKFTSKKKAKEFAEEIINSRLITSILIK